MTGLERDFARLRLLRLRQHNPKHAVLEGRVDLIGIDRKGKRETAAVSAIAQLVDIPGCALRVLRVGHVADGAADRQRVLVNRHLDVLGAHAGDRGENDGLLIGSIHIERERLGNDRLLTSAKCAHALIPDVEMPSMRKRWARKKSPIIGTVKITEAAIHQCGWVIL